MPRRTQEIYLSGGRTVELHNVGSDESGEKGAGEFGGNCSGVSGSCSCGCSSGGSVSGNAPDDESGDDGVVYADDAVDALHELHDKLAEMERNVTDNGEPLVSREKWVGFVESGPSKERLNEVLKARVSALASLLSGGDVSTAEVFETIRAAVFGDDTPGGSANAKPDAKATGVLARKEVEKRKNDPLAGKDMGAGVLAANAERERANDPLNGRIVGGPLATNAAKERATDPLAGKDVTGPLARNAVRKRRKGVGVNYAGRGIGDVRGDSANSGSDSRASGPLARNAVENDRDD